MSDYTKEEHMGYLAKAIKVSAFLAFAAAAITLHWGGSWAIVSFVISIFLL